jgi:hypothetical protein
MTSVVLSPLRKQGDVSGILAAPPAVLLQGSGTSPTATLSRTQGSSASPTATLACTQGSGTSLPDTLAHSYTPIVHLDPLLASIKGRSRALLWSGVARGDEQTNRLALSLSLATLVTPTTSTPVRDNTSHISPCVPSCANPSGQGHTTINSLVSSVEGPPGPKRQQLACQVGACCVLTDTFPLSFRWVVFNNLFSRGRCSTLGVSSSCPATAATTWYSSPCSTTTTTAVSSPDGGELDDVSPPWRKSSIRVCPATLLAAGGGDGATMARQEATPHRLSVQSESTTPAPQRGTCRALSSHLRQRRVSFPRNVPTPSILTMPALSRRTCWALTSYLR